MCQTVGKCFLDDPLANEKDAIWEARHFVMTHQNGTRKELVTHLKSRHISIPPKTLEATIKDALSALEAEGRGPARQEAYKRILAILTK